jgi:MscS family membrane protein
MKSVQTLFDPFATLLQKIPEDNEVWQLTISLSIFLAGFLILELLSRYTNRVMAEILKKKGLERWAPYLWGYMPSLRLLFAALLLRIAEVPVNLPQQLMVLLRGLEVSLVALGFIVLSFHLVRMLDLLYLNLPSSVRMKNSEGVVNNFKIILRIAGIILVAAFLIYTQLSLFPKYLWESSLWRYLAVLVVLVFIVIGGKLFDDFLASMTLALKDTEETMRLGLVLNAALWPIRIWLFAIGIYAVDGLLPLSQAIARFATTAVSVLGAVAVVFFAYRLLDVLEYELTRFTKREDTKLDLNFVKLVRMLTSVMVVVFGAVYIFQAITGKPLNAVLAGLGIGGLAVALAAQDTLRNFFGSIMIMLDKPFVVGDRVTVEGVDGPVEDIGFRSTRIRTFTGHLVAVPNEKMAKINIENIGRRPSIRRLTNITITYDTSPEKVERALTIIKDILNNHKGMDPEFPPRVYFNEFNDASLNLMMIYWYFPPDYWDFLAFNERVNLQIMKAFEAEGIEFAFPTTTTYLAQDDRRPLNVTISSDSGQTESDGSR